MPDFSGDMNKLVAAGRSWNHAADSLSDSAEKAETLEHSHKTVAWGAFQAAWDAQVRAAVWMKDRLREGSAETDAVGNTLVHVANVYMQQDADFADVLLKIDQDI